MNTNIYSYLETSGGQSSNPMLIRHLWRLKTVVFLHRCLICALILHFIKNYAHLLSKTVLAIAMELLLKGNV